MAIRNLRRFSPNFLITLSTNRVYLLLRRATTLRYNVTRAREEVVLRSLYSHPQLSRRETAAPHPWIQECKNLAGALPPLAEMESEGEGGAGVAAATACWGGGDSAPFVVQASASPSPAGERSTHGIFAEMGSDFIQHTQLFDFHFVQIKETKPL